MGVVSGQKNADLVFDLWRAFIPEVEFEYMGENPLGISTFWVLIAVNRSSSFQDMTDQNFDVLTSG